MFLRYLSKREKTIAFISLAFITTVMFYNFIFQKIINQWNMLNTEIQSKSAILRNNIALLNRYKALDNESIKIEVFKENSKSEEEQYAMVLSELENLSVKSQCYISDIKPAESKKIGNYKELSIEVTAEASIETLSQFMYEIENSKDYLRIKRFTISSESKNKDRLKGVFVIKKIIIGHRNG